MTKSNETSKSPVGLFVYAVNDEYREAALALGKRLNVEVIQEMPSAESNDLVLRLDESGLSLVGGDQMLRGDFTRMLARINRGNVYSELLVKASKIKGVEGTLTAIDATAGLGEDAILLAAAGFSVQLYERDPVIAELLEDTMCRASKDPDLEEIVGRMKLIKGDSLAALPQLTTMPDVILLDPMFPARQKSALIKKKFQLLQQLEQPCTDEDELLHAAIAAHPRKVVIKRPIKGAYLAGRKPDYSIKGKAVRYDCIVLARPKTC